MSTSNCGLTDEEKEYLAEREVFAVHDGGLSQEDTKVLAYKCYIHKCRPEFKDYYSLPG